MNIIHTTFQYIQPLIPLKLDKTKFIVVHHIDADTATPEDIHQWHLGFGWAGFGYNEYIRKDGTVYIGRGDNIGAQCQGFNSCSYGIALEGNFDTTGHVPDAQWQALLARIQFHLARFPKNCVVVPHRELVDTSCPGQLFPFSQLLSAINAPSDTFKSVLNTLVNEGIINSPGYWTQAENTGSLLKGEYVKILLTNMAKFINQHK